MAELIKTTDSLNDGRLKLNAAITDSETALQTANTAKETAELAKAESENTQTQLNTIVINGDSSVEAAQARVNNSGTAFPTLKQRLDAEHQEVTAQLQQTEQELSSQLANIDSLKADKSDIGAPLSANLVSEMTDTARVYVYTGSEVGYTFGNWYSHNGTAWVSGGVYNSQGIGNLSIGAEKTKFVETLNMMNYAIVFDNMRVHNATGALEVFTGLNAFELELTPGSLYYISKTSSDRHRMWLLDENKTPISSFVDLSIVWDAEFTHPTAKYLRGTWDTTTYPSAFVCKSENKLLIPDGYKYKVDRLYNDDAVKGFAKASEMYDLFNLPINYLKDVSFVNDKFINSTNGTLSTNTSYTVPDAYIPMTLGKRYCAFKNGVPVMFPHYAIYNENKDFIRGGSVYNNFVIEPADSTEKYFRFSILKTEHPDYQLIEVQESTDGVYKETKIKDEYIGSDFIKSGIELPTLSSGYAETLSDGEVIELDLNAIKKNKVLSFASRITSFSSVRLGHGQTEYGASYIDIDTTTIKLYNYATSATLTGTFDHGLTISGFLHVFMNVDKDGNIVVRLSTNGGTYETTPIAWNGYNGKVFAKSVGSTLNDCELTWDCADYVKPIYAFGDSYMGIIETQRWPNYIRTYGFDNWLVHGYPGQNCASAYDMLLTVLNHKKPKYILWALGMNDPDTTVVNASWKSRFDSLKSLCEMNNIELIACTIPNTPTMVNTYKNDVVRSSGLRYIDFNKAVGADLSTSWFPGMLHADNVHPTALGAKALAQRALMDFPELARN